MSFTTFPPNSHTLPVSFAPFRAYLETERPALIKTLAKFPVHGLETERPSLEEIFMTYYEEN